MATISEDQIAVKFVVDTQDLAVKLQEIDKRLKDVEKSATDTGKNAGEGFSNFGKSAIVLNQALGLTTFAFKAVAGSISTVLGLLNEAGEIDSLTRSFETLQNSVGNDATQALDSFRTATQGLVSDLDLIQSANRAVQLGLPTEGFEEASASAIKLGRAMGIDATQAINDFTTGVGRGSVQILDNLGIIVKANEAYERFAEANKIVGRELTETEKKLAFQQEAYRAVIESAKNTADVTLNTSDAFTILGNDLSNVRNEIIQSIANNDDLRDAFLNVSSAIKEIDTEELIDGLASIVSFIASIIDYLPTLTAGLQTTFNLLSDVVGYTAETVNNFYGIIDTGSKQAQETLDDVGVSFQKINQSLSNPQSAKSIKDLASEFARLKVTVQSSEELTKLYSGTIDNLGDKVKVAVDSFKDQNNIQNVLGDVTIPKLNVSTEQNVKANEKQAESTKEATKQALTLTDAIENSLIQSLNVLTRGDFNLDNLTSAFGDVFKVIGQDAGGDIAEGIAGIFGTNSADLAKSLGIDSKILGQVGGAIGSSFVEAFARETLSGIQSVLSGERLSATEKGALALPTFGLSLVFDDLSSALSGNKNVEANARQAIEDIFNKAIEEASIDVEKFSVFGRDSFDPFIDSAGEATSLVGERFKQLEQDSQSFFLGIGSGLESALEVEGLSDGQLGQLLAVNFGVGINSANDLQLILQSMGLSAEQLGQQIEEAWLRGDVSASEFINTLNQSEELFRQGIPNAVGATGEAFDNLVTGGLLNGREALDALGDIGAEAFEILDAGGNTVINTLEDLRLSLLEQGKPIEDIDALFQAFAENGVSSIEELQNVTARQAGGIINSLQNLGFGFTTASEDIAQLAKDVEAIKSKSVDIDVNIRTNVDSNTRDYQNVIAGNSGGLGGF